MKNSKNSKKKFIVIGLVYFLLFASAFVYTNLKKIPNFSLELPRVEHHASYDTIFLKSRVITSKMATENPDEILLENQFFLLPTTGYITQIIPSVHGTTSKDILHHSVIAHLFNDRDLTCPNYNKLLFASGKERTVFSLPPGYGYPVKNIGEVFDMVTHFRNSRNEDMTKIYFEYEIKVSKEKLKPVDVIRLDVDTQCNYESAFAVDPNSTQTFTGQSIMPFTGKVIAAGGHIHEYSTGLQIYQNGNKIMNFKAITDDKNQILSIPRVFPSNSVLKKGDRLDIKSTYINPFKTPIEGMALFYAYIAKE